MVDIIKLDVESNFMLKHIAFLLCIDVDLL